jgi:hypothetical protein
LLTAKLKLYFHVIDDDDDDDDDDAGGGGGNLARFLTYLSIMRLLPSKEGK